MNKICCPNCGSSDIQYNGDMSNDYFDLSTYYCEWKGVCAHCGKKLRWTEVYQLTNIINMKEDE